MKPIKAILVVEGHVWDTMEFADEPTLASYREGLYRGFDLAGGGSLELLTVADLGDKNREYHGLIRKHLGGE